MSLIHRAILSNNNIINNEEILLRFIRADRLDTRKALNRLLQYYSLLVEIFGEQVALHQSCIRLEDLDRQQRKLLESGWIQLLLTRDKAGRRILTIDEVGPYKQTSIINKVRTDDEK